MEWGSRKRELMKADEMQSSQPELMRLVMRGHGYVGSRGTGM